MKVKGESEIAQSCLTLSDPMDCSLPGSSVHGIFQARVLEWGAIAFSVDGDCSHEIRLLLFWQENYDKPRQCVEKQRHYSANKVCIVKAYGLPSGHIWF